MNIANIDKAIAIMRRAGRVKMDAYQDFESRDLYEPAFNTEEKLHACGSAACFAGWVAVSPEFQADGGTCDGYTGAPMLDGFGGPNAIALWLDIDVKVASSLVVPNFSVQVYDGLPLGVSDWSSIGAAEVIKALERVKSGEFDAL